MPACALLAQKNFVLHRSRPGERPAYAGMTGTVQYDGSRGIGWCCLVHPHPSPLPSRERGFGRLVLACCCTAHPASLWIADQVRNDGGIWAEFEISHVFIQLKFRLNEIQRVGFGNRSRYLCALPVTRSMVHSCGVILFCWSSFFIAARVAPPSGAGYMPSLVAISVMASSISWSDTVTISPPLSRTALITRKSPTAAGTLIPAASVLGFWNGSANCWLLRYAFTIGEHPSACTHIILGRSVPIHPSFCISSSAFHIPTIPVPPPVG